MMLFEGPEQLKLGVKICGWILAGEVLGLSIFYIFSRNLARVANAPRINIGLVIYTSLAVVMLALKFNDIHWEYIVLACVQLTGFFVIYGIFNYATARQSSFKEFLISDFKKLMADKLELGLLALFLLL